MPTFGFSNPTSAYVIDRAYAFVRVCESWSDNFQYVPYLTPIKAIDAVAPEVGEADFLYQVGTEIKQHDTTTFAEYEPLNLKDWFVQILIQFPGYRPVPVWHGIITETQLTMDRSRELCGPQAFKAYGLGHLLDRKVISQGRIWGGSASDPPKVIDWVPKVNERYKVGKTLHGNMSPDVGPDDCHLYKTNGNSWTNLDYAEYTLTYIDDEGIDWLLSGETSSLDQLIGYYDFDRQSVWRILDTLINRRHGLGFYVRYDGEGTTVYLEVFTLTDRDVSYGDATLFANSNKTYFTMPTNFPAEHEIADVPFRVTSANQYDVIRIQGERILTVGSFAQPDETLDKGWTDEEETTYLDGAGGSDAEANSKARSKDKHSRVFSAFIVPPDWDGIVISQDDGNPYPLMIATNKDGTIDRENVGDFWMGNKRFDRQLPFQTNVDYTADGPDDNNDEDAQPEFHVLKAFIADTAGGPNHTADSKYHYVDRLSEDFSGSTIKSMHVRPLDNEMGIELSVNPRHYLALNHWSGAGADTTQPEFDWEDILITAAVRHDLRPTIEVKFVDDEGQAESNRVLDIIVPGVELWYCAPGTVIDIDADGEAQFVHENNLYLRDDTSKLWAFAAFAIAWYGVDRQAIQIPIKKIGLWVRLGTYITGIANVGYWLPVNTCVTGRIIDFAAQTTVIETGHNAQDMIVPMMADVGSISGRAKLGGRRG